MTDDTPYCVEDDCHQPATTSRPLGMTARGTPVVELVCDTHATDPDAELPQETPA